MNKPKILRIISLLFILGGLGRLVANRYIFGIFGMEHLWSGGPFFIYNYRLLGVFVLWVGIILFICSGDLIRYRGIIRGSILGLFLFFVISLWAGLSVGLGLKFFLVDSVFALFLVVLLSVIQKE
jgi:hypothetical protein